MDRDRRAERRTGRNGLGGREIVQRDPLPARILRRLIDDLEVFPLTLRVAQHVDTPFSSRSISAGSISAIFIFRHLGAEQAVFGQLLPRKSDLSGAISSIHRAIDMTVDCANLFLPASAGQARLRPSILQKAFTGELATPPVSV